MVINVSGADAINCRASSNSTADSIGTSSRRSGRRETAATPSQAAVKSAARPVADAAANWSSKPCSRRARSGPPSGSSCSAGGSHAGHGQIVERVRERARKSGCAGDRAEVGEALVLPGVECRAGGDGFRADERGRRDPASRQDRRREARGELREAEAMESGRCAPRHCHCPSEVVGRAARGRDDERPAIGTSRQPALRFAQASGRTGTFNDLERADGRHVKHLPGRRAGSPIRPRHATVTQTVADGGPAFKLDH